MRMYGVTLTLTEFILLGFRQENHCHFYSYLCLCVYVRQGLAPRRAPKCSSAERHCQRPDQPVHHDPVAASPWKPPEWYPQGLHHPVRSADRQAPFRNLSISCFSLTKGWKLQTGIHSRVKFYLVDKSNNMSVSISTFYKEETEANPVFLCFLVLGYGSHYAQR